jgi:hypothetical protein
LLVHATNTGWEQVDRRRPETAQEPTWFDASSSSSSLNQTSSELEEVPVFTKRKLSCPAGEPP